MFIVLQAILVLIACLPAISCDSCASDVTCSPYQANSSVQINLLQHPKVDWYKTHSIHAYSLLTHLTCVKLFRDFQSLSHIAHCNWNCRVSHAICHWNSHEALLFYPIAQSSLWRMVAREKDYRVNEALWLGLIKVQCSKPPEVVTTTALVLDELELKEEATQFRGWLVSQALSIDLM